MYDLLSHLGGWVPGWISTALWTVIVLYTVVTGVFIILENKSPAKTLAWILAFWALPILGVGIYLLFGREYRPFSRERKLLQQKLGHQLTQNENVHKFLTQQPKEIQRLIDKYPLVYDRVLELMRRNLNVPLYPHNTLELLINAKEKYPRLMADLQAAKHSIHMEYFEWASDAVMEEFKSLLIAKAQEGVKVRILYDPLGSFSMLSWRYVREMNQGGVHMLPWSSLYALHTISYRSHRKVVVIDGKIGYTGGLNMSEEHLKGPHGGRFKGWRDTHVRVTGEVVLGLQASFAVQWYNTTKEELIDPDYYPATGVTRNYLPLHIVHSGPDAEWKAIRSVYFALITAAQKRIYIQSPFFILDEGIAEAIAGAARSGIEVKIMLAPRGPGMQAPYQAAMTYAADMARAGVEIYFYEGYYFHPKTISVDSIICSIGSTNVDIRSFAINYELNLIVYDVATTQKLEETFQHDLKYCERFDLEAYENCNVLLRARDSLMRLLSPLM
ncbi:MAG: cardiolipin synthase [Caldilineaceae bacterium]|nr:cardiolipin synthase [Caldilineaceae bacterium]